MIKFEPIIYDENLTAFDLRDEIDLFTTKLILDDYDWMTYKLMAWLPTKAYGDIKVKFIYEGWNPCTMIVKTKTESHRYSFDSSLFKKHIVAFLTKHCNSWNEKYAFRGIKEVVDFYNEVITDSRTVIEKQVHRNSHRYL